MKKKKPLAVMIKVILFWHNKLLRYRTRVSFEAIKFKEHIFVIKKAKEMNTEMWVTSYISQI